VPPLQEVRPDLDELLICSWDGAAPESHYSRDERCRGCAGTGRGLDTAHTQGADSVYALLILSRRGTIPIETDAANTQQSGSLDHRGPG